MKYKCDVCHVVFDESKAKVVDFGNYENFWGNEVWMPYLIDTCPYCGSEYICEYVGGYFEDND